MAIFEYGKYKIDIDEEKTKKYFEDMEISECQGMRNFQKYVREMISDEEKAFFESLHINLSKVDFCYGYLLKNKKYSCNLQTYIIGDFLSYPDTDFVTIDEVRKQGFEIPENIESNDINVGNFKVHIYTPAEYDNASDDYENSIYIEIDSEDIPWLLNEKCKDKEISPFITLIESRLLDAIYFIPNIIRTYKDKKVQQKKLIEELEKLRAKHSLNYEILSNKEMKEYKKLFVDTILARNSDEHIREKAYEFCLPHKKYETYLWHIFSFDLVKSLDNPTKEFEKIRKKNCTLMLESCNHTCVNLENAENLTEQDIVDLCSNVSEWCDFVIAAEDFSWAYSRTHEDGWCGPYFFRKE